MAKKLSKGSLLGFLRSRPYVSVADIRRRFLLETDDATPLRGPEGYVYIGLPPSAAETVRQLWSEGKIGLHFSPNIRARSVEGLYATRLDFGQRSESQQARAALLDAAAAEAEPEPDVLESESDEDKPTETE